MCYLTSLKVETTKFNYQKAKFLCFPLYFLVLDKMTPKNFPLGIFFKRLMLYLYCSLSLWQLINSAIYSFQTSLFSQFPDTRNYLPGVIFCVESSPNIMKSAEICQMGQILCFKVKKQTSRI